MCPRLEGIKHKGGHAIFFVWLMIGLAVISMPTMVVAEGVETAEDLLEIERQIEVNKRVLELRELQFKRQEQDMRFYQGRMGTSDGPTVVQIPHMTLDIIRTYKGELIAGLRYGMQYLDVRKGDQVAEGIKVTDVNELGVALNVHGSAMRLGLHSATATTSNEQPVK